MIEQLREQLKEAFMEKDEVRVGVLRLLLAALEYKKSQILKDLDESEVTAVIKSEVKKRNEAIEIYKKAGNDERAAAEEAEKLILEEFLPEQLGEEVIREKVVELIDKLGKDANRGQLIGMVISELGKENVDGSEVAKIVAEELS